MLEWPFLFQVTKMLTRLQSVVYNWEGSKRIYKYKKCPAGGRVRKIGKIYKENVTGKKRRWIFSLEERWGTLWTEYTGQTTHVHTLMFHPSIFCIRSSQVYLYCTFAWQYAISINNYTIIFELSIKFKQQTLINQAASIT